MSKFAFASVRTCLLGAAALLSAVGVQPASADKVDVQKALTPAEMPYITVGRDPEAMYAPDGWTAPRGLRLPAGCASGGQTNGNFVNALLGATTTGYGISGLTVPTFMRADNFKIAGTGAHNITSVKWSAWTTQGTSPGIVTTTPAQLAGLQFTVSIYTNVDGTPNTVTPLFTQTVTPTITTNGTDTVPSGNATGTLTFPVLDFDATLTGVPTVNGGDQLWMEIRPLAGTQTSGILAGRNYFWRASDQGDGVNLRRTATTQSFNNLTISNGDLAFCVSGTKISDSSPLVQTSLADGVSFGNGTGSNMACFPSNSCQTWDGTTTAFASHFTGAGFKAADNFTISSPQTISNICWQGVHVLASAAVPIPTSFQVRIMPDLGGANAGVPNEAAPAFTGTFTVGSPGPNGETLTNSGANTSSNTFGSATQPTRAWQLSLGTAPINLAAGCYFIEIRCTDTVTPWFIFVKDNARATTIADDFFQQTPNAAAAYSVGTQTRNADIVWCFNSIGVVRSTSCAPAAPAVNRTCLTATTLAVNGPTLFSNNITEIPGTEPLPPSCSADSPNLQGNFYTLVGNGQDVTVSTCLAGTNPLAASTSYDTIVHVYCSQNAGSTLANACAGPLVCIAANDDAVPACTAADALASSVTFPTINSARYLIYVMGAEATNGTVAKGFHYINATSTTASTTALACSAITPCRIDIPAGAISEGQACGETASDCTTAPVVAFNQWATGTCSSNGTRDQDIWRLPDATAAVSGGQWFTIEFRAEFPSNFAWFRSACVSGGLTNGVVNTQISCQSGDTFNVFVPSGGFHVLIRPANFDAPACDPAGRGNRYVFRVRPANVGVCCIASTACSTTISNNAARLTTDPNDCVGLNGVYLGDGTTCDANDPNLLLPCDINGAPVGSTVGACCDPFTNCSSVIQTACPAGSTFTAGGVCNPDPCVTVGVQRCCQPSGVCIVIAASVCTAGGGTPATGTTCFPNSCTQPPVGVCCGNTGVCAQTIQIDCPTSVPGITWTVGGTCTPNPCDTARACCTGTACTVVVPAACTSGGGIPGASGSVCFPDPCTVTNVTCCRGTVCSLIPAANCTAPAGVGVSLPSGGTTCNTGGSNTTPCCVADFDKNGSRTIDDIFIFLNAWFSTGGNPFTKSGGDGIASANIDDIFIFLNVWFAGGCG